MARNFRIVPKKRGNRSTGSKLWGRVVEASLSGVALLAGGVGFWIVLSEFVIPEWRADDGGWFWLALALPVSLILIGGGGVLHVLMTWGRSAERRAAFAKRLVQLDRMEGNGHAPPSLPYVPRPTSLTNSPGTTLSYRLPIVAASGWKLLAGVVACLGWNGIVALFVCVAISGFLEGRPDWLLTVFVIPFLVVGMGMIVYSFRYLLVATAIGPTLVEVSQQPLCPGTRCELFVSQTGRLKVNRLEVLLVCDEEATFHQGTNTRRESVRVVERPVYRGENIEVRHGVPFEVRFPIEVPAGTMHSFKSEHNEISWKIMVKGDIAGWPSFARSFPVIVYPSANGGNGKTGS